MKNFIVCCLIGFVSISVLAKMPDGFDKNETDKAKIEAWIKAATDATPWEKDNLDMMLAVADMNAEKTPYADFKEVFKNFVKSEAFNKRYNGKAKADAWKNLCVAFIQSRPRFTPYFTKVLTDAELNDSYYVNRECFYQRTLSKYFLENKEIFRKYFKTCVYENVKKNDKLSVIEIEKALNFYKMNMINQKLGLTKDEIAEDLRYAKLLVFSFIGKSEEWKQICVTLELMIKSNQ